MILILYLGKLLQFDFMNTALISFFVSYLLTAILSMYLIKKFYRSIFWNYELFRDIILFGLIIIIINYLLMGISDLFQLILQPVIYLLIGLIYIMKVKTGWLAELRSLLYAK